MARASSQRETHTHCSIFLELTNLFQFQICLFVSMGGEVGVEADSTPSCGLIYSQKSIFLKDALKYT